MPLAPVSGGMSQLNYVAISGSICVTSRHSASNEREPLWLASRFKIAGEGGLVKGLGMTTGAGHLLSQRRFGSTGTLGLAEDVYGLREDQGLMDTPELRLVNERCRIVHEWDLA